VADATSASDSRLRAALVRRAGYTAGIVVNTVLLYVVNAWPGWRSLAFVTADAEQLVPLLNAALIAGIVANAIYLVADRRWVKALGDLFTVGISLAFLVRTWLVFPFAFTNTTVDWATIIRVVLGFSIVGCIIALIVQLVVLVGTAVRLRSS
jgi:hypothetical protein